MLWWVAAEEPGLIGEQLAVLAVSLGWVGPVAPTRCDIPHAVTEKYTCRVINKNWLVDPFAIKVDRRLDLFPVLHSLRWRLTGPPRVSDTLPGVTRSHQSLWLGASATLATGALALVGANVAFDTVRQHYKFWTNGTMVGAYAVGVLAVFCFFAAMREWPMPLAGDRSHRREAHALVQQDPAETGSAGDVTLTPRQFGDKLVLDVRNNGPAASFTAEVIFIFRSNGDGTPDTTSGWAVPWAANGKAGLSTDAAEIPHGQQRTLDLARYDPAAVQASRSGDTSGPHWLFSSLPEPVGFSYWPPIASGRDLSARRFVVTLRVFRSSPPGWSDHTLGVGVSGSAIVCEPLPLKVGVIKTDWRDRELRDFIVAARVQVQNNSGKTVRLSPVHWMQAATPGVIAAEPANLPTIRAAVSAEQARRTPSLYDRMEIADGEVVRGWIVYGVGRSATGGKPHAFLVIRDEEGNMYPAAVEAATIRN